MVRPEEHTVEARPVAAKELAYLVGRVGAGQVGRARAAVARDGERATGPCSAVVKPTAVVTPATATHPRAARTKAVARETTKGRVVAARAPTVDPGAVPATGVTMGGASISVG